MAKLTAEESLAELTRLRAQILSRRADGLRESAGQARLRLATREQHIERLRAQLGLLKHLASKQPHRTRKPVPEAPTTAQAAIVIFSAPEMEAALDSARAAATSSSRAGRKRHWAVIAALAACALYLHSRVPTPSAHAAYSPPQLLRHAPGV